MWKKRNCHCALRIFSFKPFSSTSLGLFRPVICLVQNPFVRRSRSSSHISHRTPNYPTTHPITDGSVLALNRQGFSHFFFNVHHYDFGIEMKRVFCSLCRPTHAFMHLSTNSSLGRFERQPYSNSTPNLTRLRFYLCIGSVTGIK